jgi:hypothetical protein
VDEGHFEHAGVILDGFLEPREDASTFFQPANQSLDDVSLAICVAIEVNRPGIPILVFLGGNNRRDLQLEQTLVDPVGTVSFVSRQGNWPCDRLSFVVEKFGVCALEQGNQAGGFMVLARRQMKVKWVSVSVTQQMDFGGKTAARTA